MRLVVIESPYAARQAPRGLAGVAAESYLLRLNANRLYLNAAIRDCLSRGEAPFASHAMYTCALDDNNGQERALGIQAGFEIGKRLDARVFYLDKGLSPGMVQGVEQAIHWGQPVELRSLREWRGAGYFRAMRDIAPMIPDWLPVEWGV
jgi:hypothetical protein